jgi:1-acyl-sn-glycerol-3-phosphate acyltransferase
MSTLDPDCPRLYRVSRFLFWCLYRTVLRLESHGAENVPASGGCILASNHASFLDPTVIGVCAPRFLRFLARSTLFRFRWSAWWLNGVGAVPLDRDRGDVAALRTSVRVAKKGSALMLFPEGTRSLDGELQAAKPGVGFLVAKAGVPVVPVYVAGSFDAYPKGARWIRPRKVHVYYGPPITPEEIAAFGSGKEAYRKTADFIMARIAAAGQGPAVRGQRSDDR